MVGGTEKEPPGSRKPGCRKNLAWEALIQATAAS
jgi:hypothetical protein